MDLLVIRLLGSFQVTHGEKPLAGFVSNKVRALLAFLAVETDRPHPRRKLAALLWPELPESTALGNLRNALSNLRDVIGDHWAQPPYLEITPQAIQFNATNSMVDVRAFEQSCTLAHQNPLDFQSLEQAADLYRGSFLEGFSIPDSIAFEEWAVLRREHLDRLAYQVFHLLAGDYEFSGDYERAIAFAERQLELDPWREEAHRQLMRCFHFTGQRSAALAQYEVCRQALAAELRLEPDPETQQLYEQIHEDTLHAPPSSPAFFQRPATLPAERPRFVSRQAALNRLHNALNQAMAGRGQLMLVTGSPGQGKTALVHEFYRQALEAHPTLAAAWGNSQAYFGSGDPYLPFREILEMLTGQVEHRWEAGSITWDHARRMWHLAAYSTQALVQEGPALIGTFVPGPPLLQRASQVVQGWPSWLSALRSLTDRHRGGQPPSQGNLFQQYSRVLAAVARHVPLLLFLDDLQWADQSSLGLLFHLSRQLSGIKILIIGAFRPAEGLPSSGPGSPSLAAMVNELCLLHGDILINLDELEERDFIDAYLDLEPNRLEETFRENLFRYTHGHPLFTVEMLYGMRERGDLVKNQHGEWVVTPTLNWDHLPPRVEAAVAEHLRQLPRPFLDFLQTASVEGEHFTAEVAANILGVAEGQALTLLSAELDRNHKLVQSDSSRSVNGRRISRYRFRHILFQRYLYNQLDVIERARLHEQVGSALEECYAGMLEEIAVQLAYHYEFAGLLTKAIHFYHLAGRQVTRLSSFEDAIMHINKALSLLESQPETGDKRPVEMELLIGLSVPTMWARGTASQDFGNVCARITQLLDKVPLKLEMIPVFYLLNSYYCVRADYRKAFTIMDQSFNLAERSGDDFLIRTQDAGYGWNLLFKGELCQGLSRMGKLIDIYDPGMHQVFQRIYQRDLGLSLLIWSFWALWLLGYAGRARANLQKAIDLSRRLNDPVCQINAQLYMVYLNLLLREPEGCNDLIQSCSLLLAQHPLPIFSAELEFLRGFHQVQTGEPQAGLIGMSKSMEANQTIGTRCLHSVRFTLLAEAYLWNGQLEQAAQLLRQAEDFIEETGEGIYQAETLRLKGQMWLHQSADNAVEAEACFCRALQAARAQEAKTIELRAALNLAQLWQNQGRLADAGKVLAGVYDWFTEGFDTPDLKEAHALLEILDEQCRVHGQARLPPPSCTQHDP